MLAELFPMQLNQPVAMAVFLGPHVPQVFGRRREVSRDRHGKVVEDAGVLFLQGNREREDFPLTEAFESSHGETRESATQTAGQNIPTQSVGTTRRRDQVWSRLSSFAMACVGIIARRSD